MDNIYYTPPPDEAFEEMKKACTEVWNQYDDTYGYATKKVSRIKDIGNVGDNFMYMLGMFDVNNQRKVIDLLSEETKQAVKERMIAGGNDESYLSLIGLSRSK